MKKRQLHQGTSFLFITVKLQLTSIEKALKRGSVAYVRNFHNIKQGFERHPLLQF